MKENPKAIWQRRGLSMYPVNEEAIAMLRSVKEKAECPGEFRGVRSVKQNRLYWGIMRLLTDQGVFPTKDAASAATKIACGHVDMIVQPDTGEVYFTPKHINFGSLSQAEFNEIFEVTLDVVLRRWLGGDDYEAARERVLDMLEDPALAALGKRVSA